MADDRAVLLKFPEREDEEVADILSVLRHMASRTTSPVVRACLEEMVEDIAHLTDCGGDGRQEEDARQEAG